LSGIHGRTTGGILELKDVGTTWGGDWREKKEKDEKEEEKADVT
jgi:hypothetical protein